MPLLAAAIVGFKGKAESKKETFRDFFFSLKFVELMS